MDANRKRSLEKHSMNRKLSFTSSAIISAALLITPAHAADSRHKVTKSDGGTFEESWWETLAYCTGQTNVLAEWAKGQGKPEAAALANGSNVLWSLTIKRLVTERGISPEQAQQVALPTVRDAAGLQKQGILIYSATGKMEEEFTSKVERCNSELHDYVKTFPDDLAQ